MILPFWCDLHIDLALLLTSSEEREGRRKKDKGKENNNYYYKKTGRRQKATLQVYWPAVTCSMFVVNHTMQKIGRSYTWNF